MLTLIHGDNEVESRKFLIEKIQQIKKSGVKDVVRLDGKKVDETTLIQAMETQSLFGSDRLVVIEQLLARPKSQVKASLLSYLSRSVTTQGSSQVLLWENKPATPAQIKSLGKVEVQEFKLSKILFSFLDSLTPKQPKKNLDSYRQTLKQESVEMVQAMFIRQVRLLIQVKDGASIRLAPWQSNKLKTQASKFEMTSLLQLHRELLQLDYQIKTGQNKLSLVQSLDMMLVKI